MASNRHLGRILALQTLYEFDFRTDCGDKNVVLSEVLERNIARYDETVDDQKFIKSLADCNRQNFQLLRIKPRCGQGQGEGHKWPLIFFDCSFKLILNNNTCQVKPFVSNIWL